MPSFDLEFILNDLFKHLLVNMTSTFIDTCDEEYMEDPILWAEKMDAQWVIWFKQCEPPTNDQVIQINLGDEQNPKSIFMSENKDQAELQNSIELIRKYMDVLA